MNGNITQVWTFPSNSGNAIYETLQYSDGSTSCNCKGWTMLRKNAGGIRSCRHTRMVDMNTANDFCLKHRDYRADSTPVETETNVSRPNNKVRVKDKTEPIKRTRKLNI